MEAGLRLAAILSVVESCRRRGASARVYLGDVLPRLVHRKASEVGALTPMAWQGRPSGQNVGLAARKVRVASTRILIPDGPTIAIEGFAGWTGLRL